MEIIIVSALQSCEEDSMNAKSLIWCLTDKELNEH